MEMSVKKIGAEELGSIRDAIEAGDCVLLDVRERIEFEAEHIPLAILMPLSETGDRWGELDPNRKVVLYCRSGGRSKRAAEFLAGKGFKDISILEGGISSWKHLQRQTVAGR